MPRIEFTPKPAYRRVRPGVQEWIDSTPDLDPDAAPLQTIFASVADKQWINAFWKRLDALVKKNCLANMYNVVAVVSQDRKALEARNARYRDRATGGLTQLNEIIAQSTDLLRNAGQRIQTAQNTLQYRQNELAVQQRALADLRVALDADASLNVARRVARAAPLALQVRQTRTIINELRRTIADARVEEARARAQQTNAINTRDGLNIRVDQNINQPGIPLVGNKTLYDRMVELRSQEMVNDLVTDVYGSDFGLKQGISRSEALARIEWKADLDDISNGLAALVSQHGAQRDQLTEFANEMIDVKRGIDAVSQLIQSNNQSVAQAQLVQLEEKFTDIQQRIRDDIARVPADVQRQLTDGFNEYEAQIEAFKRALQLKDQQIGALNDLYATNVNLGPGTKLMVAELVKRDSIKKYTVERMLELVNHIRKAAGLSKVISKREFEAIFTVDERRKIGWIQGGPRSPSDADVAAQLSLYDEATSKALVDQIRQASGSQFILGSGMQKRATVAGARQMGNHSMLRWKPVMM